MTIAQTATSSFKVELLQAVHNFGPSAPDTFKLALYTGAASIGPDTTSYTTDGEVVGTGYAAGGEVLTINPSPSTGFVSGVVAAYISFDNVSWSNAEFTARGALIYNASKDNKAVAVLDFGADKSALQAFPFTVVFPTASANSAIVRIV